jgi:hypothetical protein
VVPKVPRSFFFPPSVNHFANNNGGLDVSEVFSGNRFRFYISVQPKSVINCYLT